jgi:tRNA(fMet)-specific endonuclease VapC
MLDTDTVSFALRGEGNVGARLLAHRPSEVCVSSITLSELRYGAEVRRSRRLHNLIDALVEGVAVAPFDQRAADRFGAVAASLVRRGAPLGGFDALIGAHALALDAVLVTHNLKHFQRIQGLRTESWM